MELPHCSKVNVFPAGDSNGGGGGGGGGTTDKSTRGQRNTIRSIDNPLLRNLPRSINSNLISSIDESVAPNRLNSKIFLYMHSFGYPT